MDVGGTGTGMYPVGSSRERRPRATPGAVAEKSLCSEKPDPSSLCSFGMTVLRSHTGCEQEIPRWQAAVPGLNPFVRLIQVNSGVTVDVYRYAP